MGRTSRQARRAQERRQLHQQQRRQHQQGFRLELNWQLVLGVAIVIAFAGYLGYRALSPASTASNPLSPTATIPNGPTLAGIGCDQGMPAGGYHVHAHLTVLNAGKPVVIGQDSGHYYAKDCLFWLHAHDNLGIIHIEAPTPKTPPLRTWFDVLARTNPGGAPNITPATGQTRKVYVNGKLYTGDPLKIGLKQHEDIWIELGPPFVKPTPFNFKSHNI